MEKDNCGSEAIGENLIDENDEHLECFQCDHEWSY